MNNLSMFAAMIFAALMLASSPRDATAETTPCPEPFTMNYPMREVLQTATLGYEYSSDDNEYFPYGSPESVDQTTRIVLARVDSMSTAERDAVLLGRLAWKTQGTIPMVSLAIGSDGGLLDTYIDILNRRNLPQHAAALQITRDAFSEWDPPGMARWHQIYHSNGRTKNPELLSILRAQTHIFHAPDPDLMGIAEAALREDPAAYARYETERQAVDEETLHNYALDQIAFCVPQWWSATEAEHATQHLPAAALHLYALALFQAEALNGGSEQFVYNSSGTFAPEVLSALQAMNLPEHAEAFETMMTMVGDPYPRDTNQRRARLELLPEKTTEDLNEATWIVDDGAYWDATIAYAKANGYWPE